MLGITSAPTATPNLYCVGDSMRKLILIIIGSLFAGSAAADLVENKQLDEQGMSDEDQRVVFNAQYAECQLRTRALVQQAYPAEPPIDPRQLDPFGSWRPQYALRATQRQAEMYEAYKNAGYACLMEKGWRIYPSKK
jgi:hypothetical protein